MKYFKNKNGNLFCVLNPSEKSKKYAFELKSGLKHTNDGELKTDDNDRPIKLNEKDKAFRYGYLTARKDNVKAYKAALKLDNNRPINESESQYRFVSLGNCKAYKVALKKSNLKW